MKLKLNLKKAALYFAASIVILIGMVIFTWYQSQEKPEEDTPGQDQPLVEEPAALAPTNPRAEINYDAQKTDEFIKIKNEMPSLAENDARLRKILVDSISAKNNTYSAGNFELTYLPSLDHFMIEITDQPVEEVRQQATEWFLEKGFSQTGVCHLPVFLYIGPNVAVSEPIDFNPLPSGC